MSEERSVFTDPADALCWLTECTLATVEHMELMRRPPRGELARQTEMGQIAIRSLRAAGYLPTAALSIRCPRVAKRLG